MEHHPDFAQLLETFRVLEEACSQMYEFMMRDKERLDHLTERITFLEKSLTPGKSELY